MPLRCVKKGRDEAYITDNLNGRMTIKGCQGEECVRLEALATIYDFSESEFEEFIETLNKIKDEVFKKGEGIN